MTFLHITKAIRGMWCVLLAAGIVAVMAPKVAANPVPWGDPALGHSWDQHWVETSDQLFNTVIAQIVAPPSGNFESPGVLSFSDTTWSVQSTTLNQILATGGATDMLEFTTHFAGTQNDYSIANPFIIDLFFLNGGNVVDSHRWIWDGNVWTDPDTSSVPDGGATVLLLGFGVLGMAAFVGKRGLKSRS